MSWEPYARRNQKEPATKINEKKEPYFFDGSYVFETIDEMDLEDLLSFKKTLELMINEGNQDMILSHSSSKRYRKALKQNKECKKDIKLIDKRIKSIKSNAKSRVK